VVWRLLEVSRQETAAAALRQLALATEIAGHLDGAHCASDLPAQLRVEVACETALRLIDHGDAAAAAGALHAAVSHLRPDLGYARAVYCRALAKLRRAQRRWEEALALADRAARLLRHHGTAPERAAAIVEQGWLMLEAGDADEAVPLFTRTLASVDTVPYPAIYCRLGLAVALVESGQAAESGDIDQLLVDSEWMIGQTRLPIDPHRLRSLAAQAAARCRRDRSR
jgi:tetratricopeptide (TPR) repeat protein